MKYLARILFCLFLAALPKCAPAQQATNVQKDKNSNITGNLTIGSGKTLTIASGGSIVAAAGSTVTGFGGGGSGNGTVTGNNLTADAVVTGNGTTAIKVTGVTIDASNNIVTPGNITANNVVANLTSTSAAITTLTANSIGGATSDGQLFIGSSSTGNFTKAVPTGTQGITITGSSGGLAVGFVAPGTSGNVLTSNGTAWTSAAPTGGGGSGTVTSVSVTSANGVSGSVATATTTPAITLSLGAITPTSVNGVTLSGSSTPTLAVTGTSSISGSHSGTSSGTNTGDQTITLTGDVTGSGTGSFAATIASGAVSNAKLANSSITFGSTGVSLGSTVTSFSGINSLTAAAATNLTLSGGSSGAAITAVQGTNGDLKLTPAGSGVVYVGPTAPSGDDTAFLVTRTPTGAGPHAFRDESVFTAASGASGYGSFDAGYSAGGTTAYNHLAAFQARQNYNGSNSVTDLRGFWAQVGNSGTGTITNVKQIHLNNPSGSGPITNNIGLYIEDLTRGTNNYAIYSVGTAPSVFAGQIRTAISENVNGATSTGGHLSLQGFGASSKQLQLGYNTTSNYGWLQAANYGTGYSPMIFNANGGNVLVGTTSETGLTGTSNLKVAGNVTATNLSGTNTGDQTITLTGDVTGSGTGSFAATLSAVNSNVGTFGNATTVPAITVNAKGLVTAVSNITISGGGSGNVTASGTPTSGQMAQFTTATNIVGVSTTGSGNAVLATNATLTTPTFSGNVTQDGANIVTASALGALAIDTGKFLNTKSISADSTFTFNAAPATNTFFSLAVTNTDTAAHTLTIPSSYSVANAGTSTSVSIPASGKLHLQWRYDGTTYWLYGDPTPISGSGTVTSFSSGNLTPLFTTSVASSTSTPALSFTLSNQNANIVLAGPTTGAAAAPTFRSLVAADLPTIANAGLANSTITLGNTSMALGSTTTNVTGLNSLTFGTPAFSDTDFALQGTANVNSYYQIELINTSSGTAASTDISLHRDGATSTTNYIDLGINSSGFTGSGSLSRASAGYVYTQSDELVVGTNANKAFTVVTNGTDRIVVTGAGAATVSGTINQTDSTASTAYTNGAFITAGGIGAAKDIITNGNLTATNGVTSIKTKVAGKTHKFLNNFSTGAQSPTAATRTYITGSNLNFTAGDLVAGTVLRWRFNVTKTAAGTAASTYDIAFGTAGSTSDTARVSFTKPAGTAVADQAWVEVQCVIRSVGASGVANGLFKLSHNLQSTGHATIANVVVNTTSASFDTTTVTNVGLCVTSGAADALTIEQCVAEAINL